MDMYLHDGVDTFRMVLKGELTDAGAKQIWGAWGTAKSILNGRELTVEVSGVSKADPTGIDLLSRMRESGARIVAARPTKCEELFRFFDIPAVAPGLRQRRWRIWGFGHPRPHLRRSSE